MELHLSSNSHSKLVQEVIAVWDKVLCQERSNCISLPSFFFKVNKLRKEKLVQFSHFKDKFTKLCLSDLLRISVITSCYILWHILRHCTQAAQTSELLTRLFLPKHLEIKFWYVSTSIKFREPFNRYKLEVIDFVSRQQH